MNQSKLRYKKLLRGLVRACIENNEPLENLSEALIEVAAEIKALTNSKDS